MAQTEFLAMLECLVVKNNEFSLSLHEQWCPQLHVASSSLAGDHAFHSPQIQQPLQVGYTAWSFIEIITIP